MKLFLITTFFIISLLGQHDAKKDVAIVGSTGKCDSPLRFRKIRNNSDSKTVIAVINQTITVEGTKSILIITDTLSPKQERDLGCAGCILNGPGNECTVFSIKSASYLNP